MRDTAGYLPNSIAYITQHAQREEVASEFHAQIEAAKVSGLSIDHLSSHGTIVLYAPWLFEEYYKASTDTEVPFVLSKEWVRRRGKSTGQADVYEFGDLKVALKDVVFDRIFEMEPGVPKDGWLSAYESMLTGLSPGVYLLKVHLGFDDEELRAMTVDHPNWGAQWRQNDFDVVSSPEFHQFLKNMGFMLVSWKDLQKQGSRQH